MNEIAELERATEEIMEVASKLGLDFFDMRLEIVPADIMYTFGAYGMPTRFSHWSFGKAFHRMKTQYDYNLSRIYELVINSDPCYAFLLEGNTLIQNKMVIAHVLAHNDFFKNNVRFANTSRQMVESMAVNANRIREYEFKYGSNKVESFLDAVLGLQEHVDPNFYIKKTVGQREPRRVSEGESPYDDLWNIGKPEEVKQPADRKNNSKMQLEKDLLHFIMTHARHLEDWQRDIIAMVREESLYFWPQMETKIMNEGWASFWHVRILRELDLSDEEAIEFAKMHASVLQPSKFHLNPYYLGMKIFEDIEKRWDDPTVEEKERFGRKGGEGRQKIFEVREMENDISFIRNYLTEKLVEELDLYLYKKVGNQWKVIEKEWEAVREGIITNLVNAGFPYIVVQDGDYKNNGELYLKHSYDGRELDLYYLEKTLPYVYTLWGRPVHLETMIDNKPVLFSYNGDKTTRHFV